MHYLFQAILLGALIVAAWVLTAESGKAIRRVDEKAKQRYGRKDDEKE